MGRVILVALLAVVLVVPLGCSGGDADTEDGGSWEATDGEGQQEESVEAEPTGNQPPEVSGVTLDPASTEVSKNGLVRMSSTASDPDGDAIEYKWTANGGSFDTVEGFRCVWRAPEVTGSFTVTLTVTDGHGGTTAVPQTFTVIDNESPVILGVTAEPVLVAANGKVVLSSAAEDADGDPLTFKWSVDAGTITGVGANVSWIAPNVRPGERTDYFISLTVEDGQGGYDVEGVDVKVDIGYNTKVFTPVAKETGTATKDGGGDTSFTRAGDNKDDEAMRAFFSFDLYELRNSDVNEATIQFTHQQTVGDPFHMPTGLNGIHVYVVRYDPGELPDYDTEPVEELTASALFESPTEFDVTKFAQRIGQNIAASDRLQFMISFQRSTNNDTKADFMEWDKAILTITYAPDLAA
jgi:hypothetical protein